MAAEEPKKYVDRFADCLRDPKDPDVASDRDQVAEELRAPDVMFYGLRRGQRKCDELLSSVRRESSYLSSIGFGNRCFDHRLLPKDDDDDDCHCLDDTLRIPSVTRLVPISKEDDEKDTRDYPYEYVVHNPNHPFRVQYDEPRLELGIRDGFMIQGRMVSHTKITPYHPPSTTTSKTDTPLPVPEDVLVLGKVGDTKLNHFRILPSSSDPRDDDGGGDGSVSILSLTDQIPDLPPPESRRLSEGDYRRSYADQYTSHTSPGDDDISAEKLPCT